MSVTVFNPRINDAAVTETTADAPAITALNEASSAQAPVDENMTTKKVFVTTQGCQMNVYDSDKMLDVLGDSHGMEVTHDIDEADVLLMNTCSIREKAQEKVFSELGRWRKLKEKRPDLVIGVGGCVASQEGDNIQKRAPYVDMVFGATNSYTDCQSSMINQMNSVKSHQKIVLVRLMCHSLALKNLTFCQSQE